MNLEAAFSDIERRAEIWSDPVGTGGFLTSFYTCGGPQPPRSPKPLLFEKGCRTVHSNGSGSLERQGAKASA